MSPPGNPRTPDGVRLYAVGDVHGRLDLLDALFAVIVADLEALPADRAQIIILGDMIDRGPDSAGVVKRAMGLPPAGAAEVIVLRGNHEDLMLRYLRRGDAAAARQWFAIGGAETLSSYGVPAPVIEGVRDQPKAWRDAVLDVVPEHHLDWLEGLGLTHEAGDYLCVHAGVRPGVALDRQHAQDLIWIRAPFLHAAHPLPGRVVVHGHTPAAEIAFGAGRIGVDTGAVYGGRLSAIVLEGDRRRPLTVSA